MVNGDNTASVPTLGFDEGSIVVTGTFGAAGNVAVEASYDGTNFFALSGVAGTVIAITAAGLTAIPFLGGRFIRAHVTAGDGTTALIASLLLRTRSRG